jgi:hypothetical protein
MSDLFLKPDPRKMKFLRIAGIICYSGLFGKGQEEEGQGKKEGGWETFV